MFSKKYNKSNFRCWISQNVYNCHYTNKCLLDIINDDFMNLNEFIKTLNLSIVYNNDEGLIYFSQFLFHQSLLTKNSSSVTHKKSHHINKNEEQIRDVFNVYYVKPFINFFDNMKKKHMQCGSPLINIFLNNNCLSDFLEFILVILDKNTMIYN